MIITYLHIINIIVYHICHRIPYIRVLVGPSQTRTLALFHSNTTFSHPERGIKIVSQFVSLLHSFRFQLLRFFGCFFSSIGVGFVWWFVVLFAFLRCQVIADVFGVPVPGIALCTIGYGYIQHLPFSFDFEHLHPYPLDSSKIIFPEHLRKYLFPSFSNVSIFNFQIGKPPSPMTPRRSVRSIHWTNQILPPWVLPCGQRMLIAVHVRDVAWCLK